MNEYLIEAMKAGVRGLGMGRWCDTTMKNLGARDVLCKKYAWAIPTDEALAVLKEHEPLIEIGAGKGYWASLLDGDIICYDCHANNPSINDNVDSGPMYYKVIRGGHDRITDHPERTLFLCWPPYDTEMAGDCLKAYTGDVFIFVGEGDGGCTGGSCFWEQIDYMTVFRRKLRAVLDEHSVYHTDACRESPGNVKGSGSPINMVSYRCICDWMDRVQAHYKEMKIVCCLCGGDATIIDHWIGTYVGGVNHADEPFAEISMECPTCPNHLRQEVRVLKVTEEEILAHPRHYTQLPNLGR